MRHRRQRCRSRGRRALHRPHDSRRARCPLRLRTSAQSSIVGVDRPWSSRTAYRSRLCRPPCTDNAAGSHRSEVGRDRQDGKSDAGRTSIRRSPMKRQKPRSLLGIEGMEPKDISALLKLAARMNPAKPSNILRGKVIVLLFYETSTRTRSSFELAAKTLGATTILITASASSIEKGESLIDTGYTVSSLGADAIVMRHPSSGAHWLLAEHLNIPIINAGDGMHEHPSQGLLDALTILQAKKSLKGLKVAIIGDLYHSRVARSNAHLLPKFGAKVVFCGPPDLCPDDMAKIADG